MAQYRDDKLLEKISKGITVLRKKHGVTQLEFYNDTNINASRIESGKTSITLSSLKVVCEYFGITLADFFKLIQA